MKEKILHEIPQKRDRFTKHFQTGHKECVAAVYPYPVHYEEDGQWKEIDNRLELKTENGKEYFGNRASALQVRFAKDAGEDHLVILKKGSHKVSWDLQGKDTQTGTAEVLLDGIRKEQENEVQKTKAGSKKGFRVKEKEPPSGEHGKKGPEVLKNLASEGIYEDILPDTDISYVLDGERLKENILLKTKKAAEHKLVFRLCHKGLEMRALNEDKTRYGLFEKEECIFELPEPYMFDADEAFSMNVAMKVETAKDESVLTLIPDKKWLLSEERAYPVTVDPVVLTTISRLNVIDVFVGEDLDETSYKWGYLKVGYENNYGAMRSFLRFGTLPELGTGAIIYGAYISLYQYGYTGPSGSQIPVYMKAVKNNTAGQNWISSDIRWSTKPDLEGEVLDCKVLGAVNGPKQLLFDVTKLARKWYNEGENYGIGLYSDETVLKNAAVNNYAKFFAVEYPVGTSPLEGAHQYPYCVINYRNVTGLEDYQSYHSQDLGYSGTGYTNDYTGNVIWTFSDMTSCGGIMPVSLGHVYNLSEKDVQTPAGWGWRLNVMQELKESGITDYPYVYIDGDGTKHYFYKDADDNDKLKDEDGLGLAITQETSTDTEAYRIMETKDKVIYTFASDGYLRKITDPDGNFQKFEYGRVFSGQPKRLHTITDGSGKKLHLFYRSSDMYLVKVSDQADGSGRNVTFGYDDNGQLLTATLPDGKVNKYWCDGEKKLCSIRNHDDRKITYEYVNDFSVPRVSRVYQTGNDSDDTGAGGTVGRDMAIAYKNGNTTVFTECGLDGKMSAASDNRVYSYHFDDLGRPSDVVRDDGRAASWQYFTAAEGTNSANHNRLLKEGKCQPTIKNYLKNPCFCKSSAMQQGDGWTAYKVPSTGFLNVTRCVNGYPAGADPGADFWKEAGLDYIDITKNTTTDLAGCYQQITLPAGTYIFSAYGSLRWVENVDDAGDGAGLFIMDTSGSVLAKSMLLTELSGSEWHRLSVSFTLSAQKTVRVMAGGAGASLRMYFTGFQLEEGDMVHRQNRITNGSFDLMSGAVPYAWTYEASDSSARYVNDTEKGTCAYLKGEYNKKKRLYQRFSCYGDENDVYSLSGWAKGAGVSDGSFKISAKVIYEDDTEKTHDIPFNNNITDWQFVNGMFRTGDDDEGSDKKYTAIEVSLVFDDQCNEARFKGIQLIKDEGESYVYDDNGNLTGARSAKNAGSFQYDAADNLRRMTDITGSAFEYSYDEKKHVVSARNAHVR